MEWLRRTMRRRIRKSHHSMLFVRPKGSITAGVNGWGQRIRSDGRAAVLKTGCGALNDLTR